MGGTALNTMRCVVLVNERAQMMDRARKAGSGGEHLHFVKEKGVGMHSWSKEEKVRCEARVVVVVVMRDQPSPLPQDQLAAASFFGWGGTHACCLYSVLSVLAFTPCVLRGATPNFFCSQEAFAAHINYVLAEDAYLTKAGVLPIDPESMALFEAVSDGIVVWYVTIVCTPLRTRACTCAWSNVTLLCVCVVCFLCVSPRWLCVMSASWSTVWRQTRLMSEHSHSPKRASRSTCGNAMAMPTLLLEQPARPAARL